MKQPHVLALCAALFLPAFGATPAHAGGIECWLASQGAYKAECAQFDVDQTLLRAIEDSKFGKVTGQILNQLETFLAVENAMFDGMPDACYIQEHLQAEIANVHAKAARYLLSEAELRKFQRELVMGRLERAVLEIEAQHKAGRAADDMAEKAIITLRSEALTYLDSLQTTQVRARMQEAIDRLVARADDAFERLAAMQEFFREAYGARLETAVVVLQKEVSDGHATPYDFQRVWNVVAGIENLERRFVPYDCGS